MEKVDLAKVHPEYYRAKGEPLLLEIPELTFLTLEGEGDPSGGAFHEAVAALYGAAYGVKMNWKKTTGQDYKVMPLEAIWWSDYDRSSLADPKAGWLVPREEWKYKLMIMTPDFIPGEALEKAIDEGDKKGKAGIERVRLERIQEGLVVQVLHVGPYATEPETFLKMEAFLGEKGLKSGDFHREIYLSDPRRVVPERMKTILRKTIVGEG